jgi:Prephenate dehydrogenase
MKVAIIGLGLIGGSIGLDLRGRPGIQRVMGMDLHTDNATTALSLGLVDTIGHEPEVFQNADVVLLAIPVNAIRALLPQILDAVGQTATVIDVGSTKAAIGRRLPVTPAGSSMLRLTLLPARRIPGLGRPSKACLRGRLILYVIASCRAKHLSGKPKSCLPCSD